MPMVANALISIALPEGVKEEHRHMLARLALEADAAFEQELDASDPEVRAGHAHSLAAQPSSGSDVVVTHVVPHAWLSLPSIRFD
jgi:hypothetical protein